MTLFKLYVIIDIINGEINIMRRVEFDTYGVCSKRIIFDIDDTSKKVYNISFIGGCNGNLKAISKLCDGMDIDQLINTLKGNTCGNKSTSCTDQLVQAIIENIDE